MVQMYVQVPCHYNLPVPYVHVDSYQSSGYMAIIIGIHYSTWPYKSHRYFLTGVPKLGFIARNIVYQYKLMP